MTEVALIHGRALCGHCHGDVIVTADALTLQPGNRPGLYLLKATGEQPCPQCGIIMHVVAYSARALVTLLFGDEFPQVNLPAATSAHLLLYATYDDSDLMQIFGLEPAQAYNLKQLAAYRLAYRHEPPP